MSDASSGGKNIVIVAGETSGDQHGAKLVEAMLAADSRLTFSGVGGPAMRAAGVRIEVDAGKLAVVGITEVVSKLPVVLSALRTLKKLLRTAQPALLILIDFPEFNLRIAGAAHKAGIPVLYYISPQIWAWRPGRVKRIAACVDHMAVILPFEEEFYRGHQVQATFVGHPLLDDGPVSVDGPVGRPDGKGPVLGLLPGSRAVEIERHLPILLSSAALLRQRYPNMSFKLSQASGLEPTLFTQPIGGFDWSGSLTIEGGDIEQMLTACDMVVAVSGTVTLQAALCGVPLIVVYKVSPLSYWIGRKLIRVPYIGLVNLVAGRQLAPELIQQDASAERIADEVDRMLSDPQALADKRSQLSELRHRLGGRGASARVADIALNMIR